MTATKEQERKALDQIRAIVNGLGADSYIGAAFKGCFAIAESNIDNDFMCSLKEDAERMESKLTAKERTIQQQECYISTLLDHVDNLKQSLEREQEWKPYVDRDAVPQKDYDDLEKSVKKHCAHHMTNAEAKNVLQDDFGFDPSLVTIEEDFMADEVNRHGQLRETGVKVNRRPIYCATDYYYIRFTACGRTYEAWNGSFRCL